MAARVMTADQLYESLTQILRRPVGERIVNGGQKRKYGDAPEPVHTEMVQAQETARTANAGAWATAVKYMTDKSNERTAPKAKRP